MTSRKTFGAGCGQTARIMLTGLTAAAIALAAPGAALAQQKSAPTEQSAKPSAKAPRKATAGQTAAHERQKKCGEEWRAAKTAGKVADGMTWPKFWSACNKRLKGA